MTEEAVVFWGKLVGTCPQCRQPTLWRGWLRAEMPTANDPIVCRNPACNAHFSINNYNQLRNTEA